MKPSSAAMLLIDQWNRRNYVREESYGKSLLGKVELQAARRTAQFWSWKQHVQAVRMLLPLDIPFVTQQLSRFDPEEEEFWAAITLHSPPQALHCPIF